MKIEKNMLFWIQVASFFSKFDINGAGGVKKIKEWGDKLGDAANSAAEELKKVKAEGEEGGGGQKQVSCVPVAHVIQTPYASDTHRQTK